MNSVKDDENKVYMTCNYLLDPETNEHCEFDGPVLVVDGKWHCPGCGRKHYVNKDENGN